MTPTGLAACVCLLALQWSGLHIHEDEHGHVGAPETAYTHSDVHQDDHATSHDNADVQDVSLLDLALGTFKLPLAILSLVLLAVFFPRVRTPASADIVFPVLSGRHTRWRPPLRAPPHTA